jgi:dTDP-4-amino-4,6-dideoxygalactose transaminase
MRRYRQQLPEWCVPVDVHPDAEPVYHLAVASVPDRARVGAALSAAGIGWGIHYPIPCHRQDAYLEFCEPLPVAEAAAQHVISLPLSPNLSESQVDRVCDVLAGVVP